MSKSSVPTMIIDDQPPPVLTVHEPRICGGRGDVQPADANIQNKINQYRTNVESEHGPLQEYVAETYQGQLVNGNNYYVKVRVAPGKHVEVVYWEPFAVNGVQGAGTFTSTKLL